MNCSKTFELFLERNLVPASHFMKLFFQVWFESFCKSRRILKLEWDQDMQMLKGHIYSHWYSFLSFVFIRNGVPYAFYTFKTEHIFLNFVCEKMKTTDYFRGRKYWRGSEKCRECGFATKLGRQNSINCGCWKWYYWMRLNNLSVIETLIKRNSPIDGIG